MDDPREDIWKSAEIAWPTGTFPVWITKTMRLTNMPVPEQELLLVKD